jgi:glycosyltransferase involved in cell wall biosynthesis
LGKMNKQRKIVHLTSVHSPFDVRIFYKECKSLVQEGFHIILVAPGADQMIIEGVRMVPVFVPKNRKERILRTTTEIYKKAIALDADLYHFHDPELMPVGIVLKLRGKKVVYDVHEELANDILDKEWIPKLWRSPISFAINTFERLASFFYDGIVITRPALFKSFKKSKTVLVHNYPIVGELSWRGGKPFSERPAIGAYVGGGTPERGIKELVQALSLIPKNINFELHMAGIISPQKFLNELMDLPGWQRVKLLGWQTRAQIAELLNKARFGIVMFLPIANHLNSEPTKLFEYMSAGLPVIASNIPHWEILVKENGFGVLADPLNSTSIADAIQYLLSNPDESEKMGIRGQEAVIKKYNWDLQKEKLVELYEGIL